MHVNKLMPISKLYKYSDSSNLAQTLISHAIIGSSKLYKTLKMKVIDAHNAGEDNDKKCCQLAVSTVQNVFKRWQFRATVEVKMRSGRSRKLWERTAGMLVRKSNENPHLTAKNLQEDLADSGVVVQRCTHKQDLHG